MFRTVNRIRRRLTLCLAFASLGLSATSGAFTEDWVLHDREQVRDLYLDGELTDHEGRRWEVGIVPGARRILHGAGDAWSAGGKRMSSAGHALALYGDTEIWNESGLLFLDGIEIVRAGAAVFYEGVPESLRQTRLETLELVHDQPFAWAPRALWRGTAGLVIEPPLLAASGAAIMASGAGLTAAGPVLLAATPIVSASFDAGYGTIVDMAATGVLTPAIAWSWHQPAFALSVLGPEPTPSQDGAFGLRIINVRAVESE